MGKLIPLEFAALGPAEWTWLALAFGGLSLLAPPGAWRRRFAVRLALVLASICGLRLWAMAGAGSTWGRLGPLFVVPTFGAGLALLGWRRLPRIGRPWLAALVVFTCAVRPFENAWTEWLFLAFLAVPISAFVRGDGAAPGVLARSTVRRPLVGAFFALCALAEPFGVAWPGALGLLALGWIVRVVIAQGAEMRGYVRRRLIGTPFVILILLVCSFILMRSAPGGPFSKEKNVDPALLELKMAEVGMDKPLSEQFRRYITNLVWYGDLGTSLKQRGRPVNEIIKNHIGPSARLGMAAIALALIIGITAGLVAGIRRNSIFDYSSMGVAMLGLALPTFIVGPFLVLAFSMKLGWFNVSGWEDFPRDLVLPAITLALPFAARLARLTRAGILEIVNQDYIRTARAKGLSEPIIVIRHTLKGAMLPVISFLGPALAQLLTGSLVVEKIFQVPGIGTEFVESALNRDFDLVLGLVVLFGTLLIVFNMVVDIAYALLDPRIRHG